MASTDLREKLKSIGQGHVLRFFDALDSARRKSLLHQLQSLDLDSLAELADEYVKHKPTAALPKEIQPAKAYPHVPDESLREFYQQAQTKGRELLHEGKVAAFLVAGGQGTRL